MTELGITKIGDTISDTGRFLGSDNTCMEAAMVDVMIATSERIYNEFKRNKKTASACLPLKGSNIGFKYPDLSVKRKYI